LAEYADTKGISIDRAIKEIEELARLPNPDMAVDDRYWAILRKLFRPPRPYFAKGLDEDAQKYLRFAAQPLPSASRPFAIKNDTPVVLRNLEIKASVSIPKSSYVKVIKDAFGLTGNNVVQRLMSISTFDANAGNVFLIAGASGAGKSIFLDFLGMDDYPLPENLHVRRDKFSVPKTARLPEIASQLSVIDYLAPKYGLHLALRGLAMVGLSEAVPLIKPFWMLSKGQRYRAKMADLLLSNAGVWLLDEFGADLDPITAAVLAANLRSIADKTGVIIFVAAANNRHFYSALNPTRVIYFDFGTEPRILKTQEFVDEFFEKID
jgi:ABC-type ATPase with predicted acetyltransferase domain